MNNIFKFIIIMTFVARLRKYSQSEYSRAVVHLTVGSLRSYYGDAEDNVD